jgi:hypothetical protein
MALRVRIAARAASQETVTHNIPQYRVCHGGTVKHFFMLWQGHFVTTISQNWRIMPDTHHASFCG